MVKSTGARSRVGIILTTSLGPLLVMFDLFAVGVSKGRIVWGFGDLGSAFPSLIGVIGIAIWVLGLSLAISRKKMRSRSRSRRARPVFLKGRACIRCYNCGRQIDASDVGYRKLITCECGVNYEMFQEGPWEQEVREEGPGPSRPCRKRRGNGRSPRRISPPPRR
ncbi:MAG: hypothetical protein R6V01_06940 [Thermoplasmatota archaeon]